MGQITHSMNGSSKSRPERTPLQGQNNWEEYSIHSEYKNDGNAASKPLQIPSDLRKVLLQYGELTQVCYDSFYGERSEETFGRNKFPPNVLLQAAPVNRTSTSVGEYTAIQYLYANSGHECLIDNSHYKNNRFWIGYVAVGPRDDGLKDIVIAWRGTVANTEWFEDIRFRLVPYNPDATNDEGPRMAEGFHHMYTMAAEGQKSPQEQVAAAMNALWTGSNKAWLKYVAPDQIGSITVCGHSLGGALATVCAFHLGDAKLNQSPQGATVPITAYTYSAPRVGDEAFRKALADNDVKVLRTVNFRDVVPKVPGLSTEERQGVDVEDGSEWAGMFRHLGAFLKGFYQHIMIKEYRDIGTKLQFDTHDFKDIMITGPVKGAASRAHNLEVLMHLIDPSRDMALMNKTQNALKPEVAQPSKGTRYIPPYWNKKQPREGIYLQPDGTLRATRPYFEEPEDTEDEGASAQSGQDDPAVSNTVSKLLMG